MEKIRQEGEKSFAVTAVLAFLVGFLGAHRFYTGYIGIGIAQLLTLGGCGIWALVDIISICFDSYKDAKGQDLADYNKTLGMVLFGLVILSIIISMMRQIID